MQGIKRTRTIPVVLLLLTSGSAAATESPLPLITGRQQLIHQQQQQQAREAARQQPAPTVRLSATTQETSTLFPPETPCFHIETVELTGRDALPGWLPLQRLADRGRGRCLGSRGISQLMALLQNRMISHGFITSRVLAPSQDLSRGKLTLAVVPGRVNKITVNHSSPAYIQPYSTLPAREQGLLDLRDIEQGLENLQRLPTVQADIQIVPGSVPGSSDLQVSWAQSRMWRLGLSLDDAGSESTGRYQGGMTLYLDNPLSLSDMFYLSLGQDMAPGSALGSENGTLHYALPFGYWSLGVTGNRSRYHQTVAGHQGDYRYSGDSKNLTFSLSRVLHRNANQKTSLSYDLLMRQSRNFINDAEVEVQRRNTSAWKLGVQHRHYLGASTLDAGVTLQRGTRWFGAQPAPEEYFDEGSALAKIVQLTATWDLPFTLFGQSFRYTPSYFRQISDAALTPQDQIALGGRWTVRGFDGELSLSADRGWYLRNDLAWKTALPAQELYLGIDYGEVGGASADWLVGKHLAGGVVGLRGSASGVGYDLFAGVPLSRPANFRTDPATFGFNLNWNY